MPSIKPKRAFGSEILTDFSGIGEGRRIGATAPSDLQNYRIRADGSLEKRCGWQTEFTFSKVLRGYWQGELAGVNECFAVGGSSIWRRSNGTFREVGYLSTTEGRVCFFAYRDRLYLLDGTAIFLYNATSGRFAKAVGYVPLYGRNWDPSEWGDVYEPLNLLSPRVRIHYANMGSATYFELPFYAVSIDCVRADGHILPSDQYDFTPYTNSFTLPMIYYTVEVAFTMTIGGEARENIVAATQAYRIHDEEHEEVLLYGCPSGNFVFGTAPVDELMLNSAAIVCDGVDPLYCTASQQLAIGDSKHPVTTIRPVRDRWLAFTDAGVEAIVREKDSGLLSAYPISDGIGCSVPGLDVSVDGDPITVNESGIWRVTSTASEPDVLTPIRLSPDLDALATEAFSKHAAACYVPRYGELWFADPTDAEGVTYVYHLGGRRWYTFRGFRPAFFLAYDGRVGFADGKRICSFVPTLTYDSDGLIEATLTSGYLTFGAPEELKRSLRVNLLSDTDGNGFVLRLQSDRGERILSSADTVPSGDAPTVFDCRVGMGRFRLLRAVLTDRGLGRSRLYRLALHAKL